MYSLTKNDGKCIKHPLHSIIAYENKNYCRNLEIHSYIWKKVVERGMHVQWQSAILPIIIIGTVSYAYIKGVDVFPVFLEGAREGIRTTLGMLPTLVGMLIAVFMLRASGAIDLLAGCIAPIMSILGIPKECITLALLKPISGSGGLAVGSEIIKRYGPDGYIGRVTATMLGASETSVYTLSIYSAHIRLKKLRYSVLSALLADITAFIVAAYAVKFIF